MERLEKLLFKIERTARILEIGPSHNPIAPKAAGWQTYVLDHASQAELQKIYQHHNIQGDKIEPVDFVWTGDSILDAVPLDLRGSFDACIASHVIEHLPDPIGFFQSLDRLLAADGVISLAVPDKRFCFDFFRPLTFAPAWIEAFERNSARHSRRSIFEFCAYYAQNGEDTSWGQFNDVRLNLHGNLEAAKTIAATSQSDPVPYVDCHAWCFTPSSFELLILELGALGLVGFRIAKLFPTDGCEFIVSLRRGATESESETAMQSKRLDLLQATIRELGEQHRGMNEWAGLTLLRRAIRKLGRMSPTRRR